MSGREKLSRRKLLWLLAAGAGLTRAARLPAADGAQPAGSASANSLDIRRDGREFPVEMRRVLIPAPGMTLPALLLRPAAAGRFPATLLPARAGGALHDEQRLRRLAAQGRVLLVPMSARPRPSDRAALQRYLRAHPFTLSGRR